MFDSKIKQHDNPSVIGQKDKKQQPVSQVNEHDHILFPTCRNKEYVSTKQCNESH